MIKHKRKSNVYSPTSYFHHNNAIYVSRKVRGLIDQRNNCSAFKVLWKLGEKGKAKNKSSGRTAVYISITKK